MRDHPSVTLRGLREPLRAREKNKQNSLNRLTDISDACIMGVSSKFHERSKTMDVIETGLVVVAVVMGAILALVVACDLVAEVWENKGE